MEIKDPYPTCWKGREVLMTVHRDVAEALHRVLIHMGVEHEIWNDINGVITFTVKRNADKIRHEINCKHLLEEELSKRALINL